MQTRILLGLALCASLMQTARAQDADAAKPEVQLSLVVGQQRVRIDGDQLTTGETERMDMSLTGIGLAYRMPAGLVLEGGVMYGAHEDWLTSEDDVEVYHYSGAVGWQFDLERWRLTPKLGVMRSKINSDGRLLLNDDGAGTDKIYDTVPFGELSITRRLGNHWALGIHYRDTFEDWGHTRSWGFNASVNW